MKKLLFILLSVVVLLSSCSSNDDIINSGNETNIPTSNSKKHTVTFNVKTADFKVETTPLRSLIDKGTFVQIIAYKDSGTVYSDTVIAPELIKDIITADGNFPFKLELPNGKYHLAFIQKSYYTQSIYGKTPETFKLKPANFNTDTYGGGPAGYIIPPANDANVDDYYQSVDITVSSSSQEIVSDIILEPMWSTVSISIDNLTPPAGCYFIRIDLEPAYSTYNLYDKLARNNLYSHHYTNYENGGLIKVKPSINNGTITELLNISKTTAENNNMKLIIKWYKDYNFSLITTTEIDLKTQVENGLHYNIKGNHLNFINNSNSMNISLGSFATDDVNINF